MNVAVLTGTTYDGFVNHRVVGSSLPVGSGETQANSQVPVGTQRENRHSGKGGASGRLTALLYLKV